MARLIRYIKFSKHCRQSCFVGENIHGDCEDSKSTSGRVLCLFGITCSCSSCLDEQQTAVSHSSAESVMSLDAGLRMEGRLALQLWDGASERFWHSGANTLRAQVSLDLVDHVPSISESSHPRQTPFDMCVRQQVSDILTRGFDIHALYRSLSESSCSSVSLNTPLAVSNACSTQRDFESGPWDDTAEDSSRGARPAWENPAQEQTGSSSSAWGSQCVLRHRESQNRTRPGKKFVMKKARRGQDREYTDVQIFDDRA